jgi:O-antigen/teichoic acid export membrane protein
LSTLNRYLKNASWYLFGSGIQGLAPLLLTPILTRTLNQSEFSKFVLFIAIGTVLSFLFSFGLPAALTRELILHKTNSENNLLSLGLVKKYLISFASILIIVSFFIGDILQVVILALALAMVLAIVQIDMAIYRALQKASGFVFLAIGSTAVPALLMTIFIFTGSIADNFLIFYAFLVFLLALSRNLNSFRTSVENSSLTFLMKMGSPTIPHGLGMSLMQYGDRIVIAAALGLTAAGQMQIAALLGTAPLLLLSTLNHAWIPTVLEKFRETKDIGVEFLNKSTKYMAAFIALVALVIMIFNSWVLKIFAPEDFGLAELSPVVVVMTISSVIYVFYLRNTHILTYLGKFQSLAWITPVSISLQIIFIFALAPSLGLLSAALAILIASSSQAALTQLTVKRLAPEMKLTTSPLLFVLILSLVAIVILN